MMSKWIFSLIELKYRFSTPALPSASGPPKTARACHGPPTQQPSRSPVKERASPPNSASDDFWKSVSPRWQIVATFSFGSAVERSILGARRVSSNPPVSAFLLFCLCFLFFCCYYTAAVLLIAVSCTIQYCQLYSFFVFCCSFLLYCGAAVL